MMISFFFIGVIYFDKKKLMKKVLKLQKNSKEKMKKEFH